MNVSLLVKNWLNKMLKKKGQSGLIAYLSSFLGAQLAKTVVKTLVSSDSTVGGMAYITGGVVDGLTWADYQSKGPKGEIYLNGNSNISFNVKLDPKERVMLGLRAVNGPANITISSSNSAENVTGTINSATEMYYDITACLGTISGADDEVTITVANTGSAILAVNHVKFSGVDNPNTTVGSARSISRSGDASTDVTANKFLPITEDDLVNIQNSLAKESVPSIIVGGVVTPVYADAPEVDDTETTEPEGGNTDVTEPEGGNTDVTEPEGGNTDVTEPEGGNTDVTEPEGGNTDVTEPDEGNNDSSDDSGSLGSLDGILDIFALIEKLVGFIKSIFSFAGIK